MKRFVVRVVLLLALVAVATTAALLAFPDHRARVVDFALAGAAVIVAAQLVRLATSPHPVRRSAFERALRPARRRARTPDRLATLERRVLLATTTAGDYHFRLRPILHEVATTRLARIGVDIRDAPRAEGALGGRAWNLVRPAGPRPERPHAPGVPASDLEHVVTTLERLA